MTRIKLNGNEKILIVRPDRIGDLVLSLPVASALKEVYPLLTIHFLASFYNVPILKYAVNVDGHILATDSDNNPISAGRLIDDMESEAYDLALFLKPGWLSAYAAYLAGIPIRVGTSRRFYSILFNVRENISRRRSDIHEADLNLMMLKPFGINKAAENLAPELQVNSDDFNKFPGLNGIDEYIVIHPGSGGSAPNWPGRLYIELGAMLSKQTSVVITGQDANPSVLPERINNLVNKTDFAQLIRIISQARLFISGSTGPLHLAAALGIPVIGLYPNHPVLGPQRWAPRGKKTSIITPRKQNGHICRIKDNGSCDCMESISVSAVFDKALGMMTANEESP